MKKEKKISEEEKHTRRMTNIAASEIEYLNDAGWVKVLYGKRNEIRFRDPAFPHGMLYKMSEAVKIQKDKDGYWEFFP